MCWWDWHSPWILSSLPSSADQTWSLHTEAAMGMAYLKRENTNQYKIHIYECFNNPILNQHYIHYQVIRLVFVNKGKVLWCKNKVKVVNISLTTDRYVIACTSWWLVHPQIHKGSERGFARCLNQTSGLILGEQDVCVSCIFLFRPTFLLKMYFPSISKRFKCLRGIKTALRAALLIFVNAFSYGWTSWLIWW